MIGSPMRRGSMTSKSRRRLRRRLLGGGAAADRTRGRRWPGRHPDAARRRWPSPTSRSSALLRTGKQLFDTSCVTCHGANLQGVPDRGPSLIGVGEAAVYFQVSTGRMPAMRGEAQAPQKPASSTSTQIDALGAYVQANGGGPHGRPRRRRQIAQESLRRRRRGPRRRPVPAQLRVLPQLHRQGRRAVVGQVRARPRRGRTSSRSTPRC